MKRNKEQKLHEWLVVCVISDQLLFLSRIVQKQYSREVFEAELNLAKSHI